MPARLASKSPFIEHRLRRRAEREAEERGAVEAEERTQQYVELELARQQEATRLAELKEFLKGQFQKDWRMAVREAIRLGHEEPIRIMLETAGFTMNEARTLMPDVFEPGGGPSQFGGGE